MSRKKMERPSTFQGWVMEESGPVKEVPVDKFLEENPGYESGYMRAYNACQTSGCSIVEGKWTDPKGFRYENVFECYNHYAKKHFEEDEV